MCDSILAADNTLHVPLGKCIYGDRGFWRPTGGPKPLLIPIHFLFWVGPFCFFTAGPFCVDITNVTTQQHFSEEAPDIYAGK